MIAGSYAILSYMNDVYARDVHETFQPETETLAKLSETRPRRDLGRSRDRLETSRPRRSNRYHIRLTKNCLATLKVNSVKSCTEV
jgi:hypothetical protein